MKFVERYAYGTYKSESFEVSEVVQREITSYRDDQIYGLQDKVDKLTVILTAMLKQMPDSAVIDVMQELGYKPAE